jgi:pimeloyl-ACP methyl ester carboxylesterase
MKKEMPELSYQDVGGAELPYLYYPGGEKKLLFAHATGFLPWLWHPIIEKFLPEYSVWAPYICNYRSCNPHEGGLSWNIIAEDLAAFCHAQKIDSPLMVGHSMGATVVTIAAAAFGIRPRAMVLVEPIFLPEQFYLTPISVDDHPLASKSIKRVNHWQNENEAETYLKSRTLFADWDKEILNLYIKYGMEKQQTGTMQLTCTPESEAAMFMGGWGRNPWPLLEKIECPVLAVEGENSSNVNFVDLRRAVSLMPRGQFASMAEASHLIPMQKPVEITSLIKNFIAELS